MSKPANPNKDHLALKCQVESPIPNINQMLGNNRFVYNHFLAIKLEEYAKWKQQGKPKDFEWLSKFDMYNLMPGLKSELEWLNTSFAATCRESIADLSTAFKNWFDGRGKYPRFKKKGHNVGLRIPQGCEVLREDAKFIYLKVPKVFGKELKLRKPRDVPDGKLCYVTITQRAGHNYASLTYEVDAICKQRKNNWKAGVDLGSAKPVECGHEQNADYNAAHNILRKKPK